MPKVKLYNSKEWLRRRLQSEHKSPEDIAKEAGVTVQTIYRKMREFGLK